MCEHLAALEKELIDKGIEVTFRGEAWSQNSREWVYFDCYLDTESLKARYQFPSFVSIHTNEDYRSGREHGFVCNQCNDAIMGHYHAGQSEKKMV